ncbi:hypothetical protein AB0E83_34035 [Streptomyces sp. NPDC035033]|uniref:hypothetical protein n=1 Tax=Streptomyces sp. NPDC035033 TaxID=3155368 RepID=UPI0033DA4BCE
MRSETWRPAREGVRDRLPAVLVTSMAVQLAEAAIGTVALFVWERTLETPGRSFSAMGLFLLAAAAPFVVAAGAVVALVLSAVCVAPLTAAAGWLGRRFSGREAWWWVPPAAAAGTAPPVLAAALWKGIGPLPALVCWGVAAVGLAVPVLVVRRLVLPDRPRVSGRAMLGGVAVYGTLAVVTAWAAAGAALEAGAGYEPPRLDARRIAGTWSDGRGGTLTLTAGGGATAVRVAAFGPDDDVEQMTASCDGAGTWTYTPGRSPWSQEVVVAVDGCDLAPWGVYGTPERPKLFVYAGDPDLGDLYVLRRDPEGGSGGDRTIRG